MASSGSRHSDSKHSISIPSDVSIEGETQLAKITIVRVEIKDETEKADNTPSSDDYNPRSKPRSADPVANDSAYLSINPDPAAIKKLDEETQLKIIHHIQYRLKYSGYFWLRIFILILTVIVILLSLSYTFGAISSTQLVVIDRCPGYTLQEIWAHSDQQGTATGVTDDICWTTARLAIDENKAYAANTYTYKSIADGLAIFQCIIFSILSLCCIFILVYGLYTIIADVSAIKQQELYRKSPHFNSNELVKPSKRLSFGRLYAKYFGVDTNGAIVRMIVMEGWEIMLQTFALLLYNGYNVWDKDGVYLAYKPQFIYLFVCILSFNCIAVGLLWLSYAWRQNKCNGLVFRLLEFCIDQVCDLFYALFPFMVVFGDEYNAFDESDASQRMWIAFGLLNNKTISSFIYSLFPLLLLCIKSFWMTRAAIHGMRNTSYELWLIITKIMNAPSNKNAAYFIANALGFNIDLQSTEATDGKTTNFFDDEIYDAKGSLKNNLLGSKTRYMVPKSTTCRIFIGIAGAVFIIYSIVLLSIVINHLTSSQNHCNNADLDIIAAHPQLFVYNECVYKVYPFSFSDDISDNCDCRVLEIDWSSYNASNITQNTVIDGVLTHYRMLEKFATTNTLTRDNEIFEWRAEHFVATELKLFRWADIDMIEMNDAISNWNQLEFFQLERVDHIAAMPQTVSKLTNLKGFMLTRVGAFNASLEAFCDCKEILILIIKDGMISSVPECITKLVHLEKLGLSQNDLTSFPLNVLNMTNLKELDLWKNNINLDDILRLNNASVDNITGIIEYYPTRSDLNLFLNSNPICGEITLFGWESYCGFKGCNTGGCAPSVMGNGQCNSVCNTEECYMDAGDCYQYCFTQTMCNYTQFLNEECDEECNNELCFWDNGYCSTDVLSTTPSATRRLPKGP